MPLINRIIPFFLAVIILTFLVFGIVLFAYLILFCAVLGIIIGLVSWVRMRFQKPKVEKPDQPQGRIIDTDDWRKL